MTIKMLKTLVLLLIAIHGSYGKHFRGGSMSWRPIPGQNKVEVTYNVGFKFDHQETRFDPCTVEAYEAQTVLHTSGYLICDSCSGDDAKKPLDYVCYDYDVAGDWALGSYVVEYDIPAGQTKFQISYESCCWLEVVSPDTQQGSRGWNMFTEVDVTPRKIDNQINSSPVTAAIPVEKYYQGCSYNLQIPVTDPDNDLVKCKYMASSECHSDERKRRACGTATKGLTLFKNCTMVFNAAEAGIGPHAVNVVIIDCPNARCKKPYSKIPLLFLLQVEGDAAVCLKPSIILPPSCNMVSPGELFEMTVMAEAGDPSKPISRIISQKPNGMTASAMEPAEGFPDRMAIKLSWTPTPDQVKEHTVCFSALDSDGYTSGRYCTSIMVSDLPPLSADPATSKPAAGEEHGTGEIWEILFTAEIARPKKDAFIRIMDEQGGVMYEVSAKSKDVTFMDNAIQFTPPQANFPFSASPEPYTIQLDEGVAMPKKGGCMSEASEWKVTMKDNTDFAILPMENCRSSMGPVDPQSCDVYLHQMTLDEDENVVNTKYNLCCTCVGPAGPAYAPGPPGGPAAPPGPPGPPGGR